MGIIGTIPPVPWVPNAKHRRIPPTARTEMFGIWLKPSQKTLLLTYFSIPHGLPLRARECDFRPHRKLLGFFARLDRVPPAAKLNPPAARPVDAVASIEAIAIPTAQFRLLKEFMVNL
jgi:hypothetical protein